MPDRIRGLGPLTLAIEAVPQEDRGAPATELGALRSALTAPGRVGQ